MAYFSPWLMVAVIVIMGGFNVGFKKRNARLRGLKVEENRRLIELAQYVGEKFACLKFIKISNTEEYERNRFAIEVAKFY